MSNPVLNSSVLKSMDYSNGLSEPMTVNGTILKTCFLALLMISTFAYNWSLILTGMTDKAQILAAVGFFAGLVLVFAIAFGPKNKFLMITSSLYAMCEGLVLGYISVLCNARFPGVVFNATIATMVAVFGMFIVHKCIKMNDTIMTIIINCTLAIGAIYLLQFIFSFFHVGILAQLFSNGPIGIGFSIIAVAVATANLLVDFEMVKRFSGSADKYFEWYFGFSMLVTIVWMYIEILNLLMKLQSRN